MSTVDDIQNRPGRLVVLSNPDKVNKPWLKPWGIESTYQVKDWTGEWAKKHQTEFLEGTVGTDLAGPFLLPGMKEKPYVYPKPFVHKVMIGANTYFVADTFLEDAYEYLEKNPPLSPDE